MEVTQIKINGIRAPIGFALPWVSVSFRVTDTPSKRPSQIRVELAEASAPDKPIAIREGADVNPAGERLDARLRPRTAYVVRVRVTGDAGDSAQGETRFETGKMGERWQGEWIAPPKDDPCHPEIRTEFRVKPGLRAARLYAAGVGLFEAYVNGHKLGREYLLPGVTNYETRIQAITFPVEGLVEGENELSFLLGKGWYMGVFGLELQEKNYGGRMAVIGELRLAYADGTEEVISTDGSFTYRPSPIVDSGIYYGETIDRTRRRGEWKPVEVIRDPAASPDTANLMKSRLTDRLSLPIVGKEILPVREVLTTPAGETVLDFGQNFAGFPEFDADFPAGTKITLDFGEILQQGNFYRGNYRDARSRLEYTSDGEKETVRPRFTFFGFRYVKVSGWPGEVPKGAFRGCAVYSDMDRTGRIQTGNGKINRLYENTLWGLKSNFLDMPTDCPQRSERLGWTGDAQSFAPTACYHMDTKAFFHKFQRDLMDEQAFLDGAIPNYVPNIGHKRDATSAWGDIAAFLPMTVWNCYGDRDELECVYPMMRGWVDYMDRLDAAKGERTYTFEPGFQFGDWLGLDGPSENGFKGGTNDRYLGAAYYYRSTRLTAQAAGILGREADTKRYSALAERIRQGILDEYFTPRGRFALDTQAAYVVALKFGLWVDRERLIAQFLERLRKDCWRIRCGFVGAPMLCTVLAENGLVELAYDFLFKEGFPSWLYCVNLGATTIWERWNSVGPDGTISGTGMNSLNHYAYGSVMEFLYAYGVGIRPAQPGFRKAIIAPNPDRRLGWMEGSYDSPAGRYVCNSRINPDGTVDIHIEIPFGCEARVTLPRSGRAAETLPAGSYDFHYLPEADYRKPFDAHTPLVALAEVPEALEILFRLTPAIGGIAQSGDPEFGYGGLADLRGASFLPFDPNKLEQAIQEVSNLIIPA